MASKFKLNNSYASPENTDYDIVGLHKKRTIVKGELVQVEYYKEFDGTTYNNLIVKEERIFTRDSIGLVLYRTQVSSWYLNNGSVGLTKNFIKYYSPTESIDEGITRRGNIINDAKIYALSVIGQAYGFDLMNSVKTQIDLYIQGYKQPLYDAVNASTKPYLNSTIKATLVSIITF